LESLKAEVTQTSSPDVVWQMTMTGENSYRAFRISESPSGNDMAEATRPSLKFCTRGAKFCSTVRDNTLRS